MWLIFSNSGETEEMLRILPAIKRIGAHPDLELVGLHCYTADKIGRDAGEIAGIGPVGVTATGTVEQIIAAKPDVLTFQTEPLEEDVTIAGPISPKLFVSTSGTDADFVVKLIDVYPPEFPDNPAPTGADGKRIIGAPPVRMGTYQQLLRGEPMRAKFRRSWESPSP